MTRDQARSWFLGLSGGEKLAGLALLAHNLTVAARLFYPELATDAQAARGLQAVNELQHTISAKLMHLASNAEERFPDQGFLDTLFEKAAAYSWERGLLQAFLWSSGSAEHLGPTIA